MVAQTECRTCPETDTLGCCLPMTCRKLYNEPMHCPLGETLISRRRIMAFAVQTSFHFGRASDTSPGMYLSIRPISDVRQGLRVTLQRLEQSLDSVEDAEALAEL